MLETRLEEDQESQALQKTREALEEIREGIQKSEAKSQKQKSENATLFLDKMKEVNEKEEAFMKAKRAREMAEREALAGRLKK